jgi:hypothetical protein
VLLLTIIRILLPLNKFSAPFLTTKPRQGDNLKKVIRLIIFSMKISSFNLIFYIGILTIVFAFSACDDDPVPLYDRQTPVATYDWSATADSLQEKTYSTFISSDSKYFIQNNAGNTSFNYWWNAHALDVFVDAYLRTKNEVYVQRMKALLTGMKDKNNGRYPNEYYDDMEWLALSSLRASPGVSRS